MTTITIKVRNHRYDQQTIDNPQEAALKILGEDHRELADKFYHAFFVVVLRHLISEEKLSPVEAANKALVHGCAYYQSLGPKWNLDYADEAWDEVLAYECTFYSRDNAQSAGEINSAISHKVEAY